MWSGYEQNIGLSGRLFPTCDTFGKSEAGNTIETSSYGKIELTERKELACTKTCGACILKKIWKKFM